MRTSATIVAAKLDEVHMRLLAIQRRNAALEMTPKRLHEELAGAIDEVDVLRRAAQRVAA